MIHINKQLPIAINSREKIISILRQAQDNGFNNLAQWCEDFLNESTGDEALIDWLKLGDENYKNQKEVKDKIIELKKEVDIRIQREGRLGFLSNIIPPIVAQIKNFEEAKEILGDYWPPKWENELKDCERKYKKLYIEYATLKGYQQSDDNTISDDILQRCREVPIAELIDGETWDAGNGRKRSRCPFHNEQTGSFFIFPDNSYHCFGCNAHGNNAVDFITKSLNLNFIQTIDYLKKFI
jgi:hypothetical protein